MSVTAPLATTVAAAIRLANAAWSMEIPSDCLSEEGEKARDQEYAEALSAWETIRILEQPLPPVVSGLWRVKLEPHGRAHVISCELDDSDGYKEGYEGKMLANNVSFDEASDIARNYNEGFADVRPTGRELSWWRDQGKWGRAEVERGQIRRMARSGDTPESLARRAEISLVRLDYLGWQDLNWWAEICATIGRDFQEDYIRLKWPEKVKT